MKNFLSFALSLLLLTTLFVACNQDKAIEKHKAGDTSIVVESKKIDSVRSIEIAGKNRINSFTLIPLSAPGDSPSAGVDPIQIILNEGDTTTLTFFKYSGTTNTQKVNVRLVGVYETREKPINTAPDTIRLTAPGTYKINVWKNTNVTYQYVNFVHIPTPNVPAPKIWGYYNYHYGSTRKPTEGVIIIVMDEEIIKTLESNM